MRAQRSGGCARRSPAAKRAVACRCEERRRADGKSLDEMVPDRPATAAPLSALARLVTSAHRGAHAHARGSLPIAP
ncbi:hypothetical protein EZV77_10735 [Burkholderia thailandensis]|nr:hypothetical protein CWD92_28930 [Burkholderia thailandensis]TBW64356.1 hypothetical protein EZV77_10735 [Burkholderia thailandensis]TGB33128.1 hypothetical protein C6946_14005 [Burkholderia thailandensis]